MHATYVSRTFSSLPIQPSLIQVANELGYIDLTPIQAESIPALLEGRDLVGRSKTGSGKTVAFALPLLHKLDSTKRELQALILCPTRELSTQVAGEIRKLGRRYPGLQVITLSGGHSFRDQKSALEKGVHIAVGTPGRVLDHLTRKTVDFSSISTLVLDEADRMLEMGFEEDMAKVMKAVPRKRQTAFFSATFPTSIKKMSDKFQVNPIHVAVEEENQVPEIKQFTYNVENSQKSSLLLDLLGHYHPSSAIVFCNLKATVMELTERLKAAGLSSDCLHGDLEQKERDRVMAKFRNQTTRFLVATDVAARGLDIAGMEAVINYDLPDKPEVYVHRIGRTGRAGNVGTAISLFSDAEKWKISGIEEATGTKMMKGDRSKLMRFGKSSAKMNLTETNEMKTLYISGGRKEKVRPGDILGALTGEAGRLKGTDVGKIEIHDHFSYVAVSAVVAKAAVERLNNGKIKGRKFKVGITA